MKKISVAILGCTGYAGEELERILARRDDVQIVYKASKYTGNKEDIVGLKRSQVAFTATPHGVSMRIIPEILEVVKRGVVDLSGAYRLKNKYEYPCWYGWEHLHPELLKEAVYGLPEKNRNLIKRARLVASAGCYETAIILGLKPMTDWGLISDSDFIEIKAASGYTGAGKGAEIPKVVTPYKNKNGREHQHIPVIEQELGISKRLLFYPSVAPYPRGITVNIKIGLKRNVLKDFYSVCYKREQFVRIEPRVSRRDVIETNFCDIAFKTKGLNAEIKVGIDNLGKGGAGQAIQNFNIMCGLPENIGLK